jgi:hypothetical protein
MDDEAARFRKELEEKAGEKLRLLAMVGYLGELDEAGAGLREDPQWGLLALMESSLRYTCPPSRHWLTSLFRSHDRDTPPKAPQDIVVPLAGLVAIQLPQRSLVARLFGPRVVKAIVSWEEEGRPHSAVFSIDPADPMTAALAGLVAREA